LTKNIGGGSLFGRLGELFPPRLFTLVRGPNGPGFAISASSIMEARSSRVRSIGDAPTGVSAGNFPMTICSMGNASTFDHPEGMSSSDGRNRRASIPSGKSRARSAYASMVPLAIAENGAMSRG
jgi:hypothetical protein